MHMADVLHDGVRVVMITLAHLIKWPVHSNSGKLRKYNFNSRILSSILTNALVYCTELACLYNFDQV